jgi:hypothetical protein
MILRGVPREERPQLRLKILAADALLNKRKHWGYDRRWEGNYLASVRAILLLLHCILFQPSVLDLDFAFPDKHDNKFEETFRS